MADFAVSAAIRAVDKFSAVLGKMNISVGKFGSGAADAFGKANEKANLFGKILGANIVGSLAVGAIRKVGTALKSLPEQLTAFTEKVDAIGKTSRSIGLSAEAFQRLQYASSLSNVSTDLLQTSFQKLNAGMGQMRAGTGSLVSVVQKLNPVLARQLRTVGSTEEALLLVSDAVAQATSASERAAIAQAAFGKSGQEMLPLLLEGRTGIEKLMREASRYGSVLSDEVVAASIAFNDNLTRLRAGMTAVKERILGTVMTALTPYVEKAVEWVSANKDLIATRIELWIDKVTRVLRDAKPFVEAFIAGFKWIVDHREAVLASLLILKGAFIGLSAAMSANPIGAITASLYIMAGAIILVIRYWKEITGALEAAWNWFNKLFGNPWIAGAIYFLSQPIWLAINAVRTPVDLLSGKGWSSLQNLIPAWARGLTDKLGITDISSGQWGASAQAPNEAAVSAGAASGQSLNGKIILEYVKRHPEIEVRIAPTLSGYVEVNP